MRRQIAILVGAQALYQTGSTLVATVGSLAGEQIAPTPALATAPIAATFLGTALTTFPASLWMERVGRRAGFLTGTSFGVAGGVFATLGVLSGSLALLAFGTFLLGAYQGFAQFYRFAASELAGPAYRSRAISLVLSGGVVAAIVGPNLARLGRSLLGTEYAGSFVLLTLVGLTATALVSTLRIPDRAEVPAGAPGGRPLRAIVAQPTYLVALFGAATGYGVMILAMTATPIAMHDHGHGLGASAAVIQVHVLGMFVPSFFTGSLIARFGVDRIMLAGVALLTCHVLTTFTGTSFWSFAVALVLLGVGWNFLYIGGTTLLTTTYTPAERGRAQAANDMTIFVVGLVCSLSSGALVHAVAWQRLNALILPWITLAACGVLWYRLRWLRPSQALLAE